MPFTRPACSFAVFCKIKQNQAKPNGTSHIAAAKGATTATCAFHMQMWDVPCCTLSVVLGLGKMRERYERHMLAISRRSKPWVTCRRRARCCQREHGCCCIF